MRHVLLLVALAFPVPAGGVQIDWVSVGGPGNACDTQPQGCFGSVADTYFISKYEVTNAQYAEFLNTKAAADPLGLYNPNMSPFADPFAGGITRTGAPGSFTYSAISGRENWAVSYVSFYDAIRFANWLHNGQGSGDTETGAYTLLGGTATPSNGATVTRNGGATIFLTSEDEWFKAAYYDAVSASYFDYPVGSDTATTCAFPNPAPNQANCNNVLLLLTDVGSYTGSASPNGTFDQGGNVREWTEAASGSSRISRGGSLSGGVGTLEAFFRPGLAPTVEQSNAGFRVASLVPEPGIALLLIGGLVALALRVKVG